MHPGRAALDSAVNRDRERVESAGCSALLDVVLLGLFSNAGPVPRANAGPVPVQRHLETLAAAALADQLFGAEWFRPCVQSRGFGLLDSTGTSCPSRRPPNPRSIEHASGAVANYRFACLV